MEEVKNEKKKGIAGKIVLWIVIILFIVAAGLGGAYIGKLYAEKENKVEVKEDNKEKEAVKEECETIETLRIDSKEVNDISTIINNAATVENGNNLLLSNKDVTYNDISEQLKNNNASSYHTVGPQVKTFIVKATKEDNKYTIILKAIFPESYDKVKGDKFIYYSDYNRTQQLKDLYLDENMGDDPTLTLENMKNGSTYELTFTSDNNEYVFESSKLLND